MSEIKRQWIDNREVCDSDDVAALEDRAELAEARLGWLLEHCKDTSMGLGELRQILMAMDPRKVKGGVNDG